MKKQLKIIILIFMVLLVGCQNNDTIKSKNQPISIQEKHNKEIKSTINKELLDEILKSQNNREYYVYIENLNNGETYTWGDESFHVSALGTVFIPILITADKHLLWGEKSDLKSENDEVELLIKDMIRFSDSNSANNLLDLLGGKEKGFAKINELLTDIGCSNTTVNRYLGDTTSVKDNYTTASDMAIMFKYIYNKNNQILEMLISSNEDLDAIKKTMYKHDEYKSASGYGVAASGYRGINKNIYNNSGLILSNDSEKNYVISVMSIGDDDISDSFNTLRKIVSTLIEKEFELISPLESSKEAYKSDSSKKHIVVFEDKNLEKVIREEINKPTGDILKSDVEKITKLDANGRSIKSVAGLEYLKNLDTLFLFENQISNIEPLRELTNLTHLDIEGNRISYIEPLSGLTNLKILYIDLNSIDDFTPIKHYIKNLESFSYDAINKSLLKKKESTEIILNPILDILIAKYGSHFSVSNINLYTITELTGNDVSSERRTLDGLELLSNLTHLSLSGQDVKDLTPLKELTNLTHIDLSCNVITSIEPLKDLPNLKYLNLKRNYISDIEPLKDFKSLPEIYLDDNPISDRSPIDEYYKKLNKDKEGDNEYETVEDEKITFQDEDLEKKIREKINKPTGDILKEDVKYILSIDAESCGINNISGIENLSNLTSVSFSNNNINDLSPLKSLNKLTHLNLGKNQISNLEPLRELTNLVNLDLSYNKIKNIDALKELTKLISLNLVSNDIKNIESLKKLNNLVKLQLEFNQIEDYYLLEEYSKKISEIYYDINSKKDSLEKITFQDKNLEKVIREKINKPTGDIYKNDVRQILVLHAEDKNIKSISGLENLSNLNELILYNNQISKLEPLRDLTNLTYLDISKNNITDIDPLGGLTNLYALFLEDNNIIDFYALEPYISNLEQFTYDKINRNSLEQNKSEQIVFEDIIFELIIRKIINKPYGEIFKSDVENITEITKDYTWNKGITNISGIENLTNLTKLYLGGNYIKDLTPLKKLTNLTELLLGDNKITDIKPLSKLTNLTTLVLVNNEITDIEPLVNLNNLNILNLGYNKITDIESLSNLNNLTFLNIEYNSIDDYSPVESYYENLKHNEFFQQIFENKESD